MKRSSMIGLGAIAIVLAVPFVSSVPLGGWFKIGSVFAENVQHKPQVQLRLLGERRVVEHDAQGKAQVSWRTAGAAQPGDVIRYTLSGKNSGDRSAQNLILTQPIPTGSVYVLDSATVTTNDGAAVAYSIDGGHSFVAKPTIQVQLPNGKVETRPASADRYTHIRWKVGNVLAPSAAVNVAYQVQVR